MKQEATGKLESLASPRASASSRDRVMGPRPSSPTRAACYTNFRIPLDSDRLPGYSRATYEKCYYENEPIYLSKNDQDELNKIELAHRARARISTTRWPARSTSETGAALNGRRPASSVTARGTTTRRPSRVVLCAPLLSDTP